jgi:diacylglycerol kinase family enzyme
MPGVVTSPFGTLAVIADPADGDGRVGAELPALERALGKGDLDYRLTLADPTRGLGQLASAALDDGARFVVAVGSDATVQDVVNGMFRDGRPIVEEAVLGVVAANTGNQLVRSFGLPGDTEGGVRRLAGADTYPFDVMKVTCAGPDGPVTRYATNLAMMGLAARVELQRQRMPGWLGERGRAFASFWRGYVGAHRQQVSIAYDTKRWDGETFQIIVGNAQYGPDGLRLSPRSWPGDGVLDALVFTGQKSDAYTMMPRIMRHGDHIPDPNIHELRAKIRFAIDAERPMTVVADGREFGATPATFQVVAHQLLFKL